MPADIPIELEEGSYRFLIWADYVDSSTEYYDTENFAYLSLAGEHSGCNDRRDAFRGCADFEHYGQQTVVTVPMERPMAKFTFIATDFMKFMQQEVSKSTPTKSFDIEDYHIVFSYPGFMPNAFNMFTDKPADAVTGVKFDGELKLLENEKLQLGFDYVFVNGKEASVSVAMTLYDSSGNRLSSSSAIEVPLLRSQHTVVMGNFLTMQSEGFVEIETDFDGDHNIEIK